MRRLIDVVVALGGLILLSPVMLLIALAVAAFMGRPIFFRQRRVGRGGAPFDLVKFRTMNDTRDAAGDLLDDDRRTTTLGRLLRRTRLDELPELWNVLTGEMSVIGPRPLPDSVPIAAATDPLRTAMRPGLTGWAQVNGNALLDDRDKLALDLWYVEHASLKLDLLILARTIGVILHGDRINQRAVRGAYESGRHWCC